MTGIMLPVLGELVPGGREYGRSYLGVNLMYEKDITAGKVTDHIYGDGMQVAKVTGGTTFYYHEDQVGSNRLVTYLKNGAVAAQFSSDYQPYGANYNSRGSESLQYTGRMLDSSDSLYYFNARVYDPSIMRFYTRHPPQASTGTCSSCSTKACSGNINSNLYSYASNNPLTNVSPSGDAVVATSPTPQQTCVEQCVSRGGTADRCLAECTSPPPSTSQRTFDCWNNSFQSCHLGLWGLELACVFGCGLGSILCGIFLPVCLGGCVGTCGITVGVSIVVYCAINALHACHYI